MKLSPGNNSFSKIDENAKSCHILCIVQTNQTLVILVTMYAWNDGLSENSREMMVFPKILFLFF